MFLRKVEADNFRTLTKFCLTFNGHYTAICGKNNSGKTNVIKAVRYLLSGEDQYYWDDRAEVRHQRDRTAWDPKGGDSPIRITVSIELSRETDLGLIEFVSKFATTGDAQPAGTSKAVSIRLSATLGPTPSQERLAVRVGDLDLDDFSSQELIKKLRSASACVYHNSTSVMRQRYIHGGRFPFAASLPPERQRKLAEKQSALTNEIDRCLVQHREQIGKMIGRLSEKYDVTLNVPELALDQLPFVISLGEKGYQVPLDEWGSGTRNRTLILRTLFEAKQAARATAVSDRQSSKR